MIIIKNIINIIQIIKFIPLRLVWLGLLWKNRFRMIKTFPKFRPIFVSICLRAFFKMLHPLCPYNWFSHSDTVIRGFPFRKQFVLCRFLSTISLYEYELCWK